jgi:hypothetical protein
LPQLLGSDPSRFFPCNSSCLHTKGRGQHGMRRVTQAGKLFPTPAEPSQARFQATVRKPSASNRTYVMLFPPGPHVIPVHGVGVHGSTLRLMLLDHPVTEVHWSPRVAVYKFTRPWRSPGLTSAPTPTGRSQCTVPGQVNRSRRAGKPKYFKFIHIDHNDSDKSATNATTLT